MTEKDPKWEQAKEWARQGRDLNAIIDALFDSEPQSFGLSLQYSALAQRAIALAQSNDTIPEAPQEEPQKPKARPYAPLKAAAVPGARVGKDAVIPFFATQMEFIALFCPSRSYESDNTTIRYCVHNDVRLTPWHLKLLYTVFAAWQVSGCRRDSEARYVTTTSLRELSRINGQVYGGSTAHRYRRYLDDLKNVKIEATENERSKVFGLIDDWCRVGNRIEITLSSRLSPKKTHWLKRLMLEEMRQCGTVRNQIRYVNLTYTTHQNGRSEITSATMAHQYYGRPLSRKHRERAFASLERLDNRTIAPDRILHVQQTRTANDRDWKLVVTVERTTPKPPAKPRANQKRHYRAPYHMPYRESASELRSVGQVLQN